MAVEYTGVAAGIEKRRLAAVEAGHVCKNCGGAVDISQSAPFHIVSFMTLCHGAFGAWAVAELEDI
jgi:hypothetical protein